MTTVSVVRTATGYAATSPGLQSGYGPDPDAALGCLVYRQPGKFGIKLSTDYSHRPADAPNASVAEFAADLAISAVMADDAA